MDTALFALPAENPKHPAKYTDALLVTFARMLKGRQRILDPFAGTGKVFLLNHWLPDAEVSGTEIEPEWAAQHPRTTLGNALHLPWPDGYFDAIVTSPCLTQDQRILTAELHWVPAGDIKVGQKLIAFDEFSPGVKANGHGERRRWRIATVEESYPARKECVRVNMENGESVTCTYDHPWLANMYAYNTRKSEWVEAKDLMSLSDPHVYRQLDTWHDDTSYKAGWLAGMFDGEGSLSFGTHGAPKLMICQMEGEITDLFKSRLRALGFEYNVIPRRDVPAHRKPMVNVYVNGGFPAILKALGRLRPSRLLGKLQQLEFKSRRIQPKKVRVVSVENIGMQDIQGIQTSTRTYIGEGYLHHNTYGNRMADKLLRDRHKRKTYASELARELHPDNGGALPWGQKYRAFHLAAWTEARRVLEPSGLFVLNIKDHIRRGVVQPVTDWHIEALEGLGFRVLEHVHIDCPGMRFGQNRDARVDYESVILFQQDSAYGAQSRNRVPDQQ